MLHVHVNQMFMIPANINFHALLKKKSVALLGFFLNCDMMF